MENFIVFGSLTVALIVAGILVVVAIWRGMKALAKMADSVARMADVAERVEKFVRRDEEPRVR
jgi:hypothetical protein